jgi:hypothetical protein
VVSDNSLLCDYLRRDDIGGSRSKEFKKGSKVEWIRVGILDCVDMG